MDRAFYLDLAAAGARVPIGADLVLREKPDVERILLDGEALGRVLEEAARRYRTPLAFHLMDLMVEKAMLLEMMGIPVEQADTYHFDGCPSDDMLAVLGRKLPEPLSGRMKANVEAIDYIARRTELVPIGMAIGPFSLATKLLADPITPVYMAGSGVSAAEDAEVRALECVLHLASLVVRRSIEAQVQAGAQAMVIAEPAANKAYFSPLQLEQGADTFDRYVMDANHRIKELLNSFGVDLIFHCCGEVTDGMVQKFGQLDPAILSLGSSRDLPHDAQLVPKTTVLYGNLPSRRFYSDQLISVEEVRRMARELIERMRAVNHPFILGSECDVLSVCGCERVIRDKVEAMLD